MKFILFLCALLLTGGARAEVVVGADNTVSGLSHNEVVEYGGVTADGNCFIITRPSGENWDTISYTKVYDGDCTKPLTDWGQPSVRKFRDGRVSFDYNLHSTPKGPDFDVIVISSNRSTATQYKKSLANLRAFKKAPP
ncbi:MAG: hypothetical protein WC217_02355 [Candidatus Paceibacterota bacterium]|jgi:hypothetical protein